MIQERIRTTRLGRNRFLAFAGTSMVAAAVQAWFPDRAEAAAPNGCYGLNGCPCCTNTGCCAKNCKGLTICGGAHCWHTCAYEGSTLVSFNCCDYKYTNSSGGTSNCICRNNWGSC
jgi:hypothetical protein